jgi:hypothetical protein
MTLKCWLKEGKFKNKIYFAIELIWLTDCCISVTWSAGKTGAYIRTIIAFKSTRYLQAYSNKEESEANFKWVHFRKYKFWKKFFFGLNSEIYDIALFIVLRLFQNNKNKPITSFCIKVLISLKNISI